MELSKKTTILFSPETNRSLTEIASRKGMSLGGLVREACTRAYGIVDSDARQSAVDALFALSLPVADVDQMKRESVPDAATLMP